MNKFATGLTLALALGSTAEGCNSGPKVEEGVVLTDPALDTQLKCARDTFEAVGFHSKVDGNPWAQKNCPNFDTEVERMAANPDTSLPELAETRKQILNQAQVDPFVEKWIVPAGKYATEMAVRIDLDAAKEARAEGKIK